MEERNRDSAGITIAEMSLTDVDAPIHLDDSTNDLIYQILEAMEDIFGLNGIIPVPWQLMLTVTRFQSVHGGINGTLTILWW